MYLMLDAGDVATEPSFFPELNTKPIYFGSQQTLTIIQNRYVLIVINMSAFVR